MNAQKDTIAAQVRLGQLWLRYQRQKKEKWIEVKDFYDVKINITCVGVDTEEAVKDLLGFCLYTWINDGAICQDQEQWKGIGFEGRGVKEMNTVSSCLKHTSTIKVCLSVLKCV